jgi:hypothetical protein
VSNAPRDYYVAVWRLQRAKLFDDQEPKNDTGPSGTEEVLQPVPQAHAAQGSEIERLSHFVIESLGDWKNHEMIQWSNDKMTQ